MPSPNDAGNRSLRYFARWPYTIDPSANGINFIGYRIRRGLADFQVVIRGGGINQIYTVVCCVFRNEIKYIVKIRTYFVMNWRVVISFKSHPKPNYPKPSETGGH